MSEKNNPTKEFHLEATRVHKKLLQSQEEKIEAILESDPERPIRERESDRVATLRQISELQKVLDVCLPYIRRIKSFVPKISDETVEAACYLLFCRGGYPWSLDAVARTPPSPCSLRKRSIIRRIDS